MLRRPTAAAIILVFLCYTGAPARDLYWRFWSQAAVRSGDWKLLRVGADRTMLFNLAQDPGEQSDVLAEHPELTAELEAKLASWAGEMSPAGLPGSALNEQERKFYEFYFGEGRRQKD